MCSPRISHISDAGLIALLTFTTTEAQLGPEDLRRTEGERNVIIPCPFVGSITPLWKINDNFYHHSRLPYPFISANALSALIITVVDRSLNGTSFQCFAPGVQDTSPRTSSVGVLTVIPDPLCMLVTSYTHRTLLAC